MLLLQLFCTVISWRHLGQEALIRRQAVHRRLLLMLILLHLRAARVWANDCPATGNAAVALCGSMVLLLGGQLLMLLLGHL